MGRIHHVTRKVKLEKKNKTTKGDKIECDVCQRISAKATAMRGEWKVKHIAKRCQTLFPFIAREILVALDDTYYA